MVMVSSVLAGTVREFVFRGNRMRNSRDIIENSYTHWEEKESGGNECCSGRYEKDNPALADKVV